MTVTDFINELIVDIKNNDYFADIKVVKAYPNTVKSCKTKRCAVAIGVDDVKINQNSIGQECLAGKIRIFFDIYVPCNLDSSLAADIFINICSCLCDRNIYSVNADKLTSNSDTLSYVLRTAITFYDLFEYGGDDNG